MILKSGRELLTNVSILAIVGPAGAVHSAQRQVWQHLDEPLTEEAAGGPPFTLAERIEIGEEMQRRWQKWMDSPCPYAGGRWEEGKLVGKHSDDCRCELDGVIR